MKYTHDIRRSDYAQPRPYAELDQALHTLGGYVLLLIVRTDGEGGRNAVLASSTLASGEVTEPKASDPHAGTDHCTCMLDFQAKNLALKVEC